MRIIVIEDTDTKQDELARKMRELADAMEERAEQTRTFTWGDMGRALILLLRDAAERREETA